MKKEKPFERFYPNTNFLATDCTSIDANKNLMSYSTYNDIKLMTYAIKDDENGGTAIFFTIDF